MHRLTLILFTIAVFSANVSGEGDSKADEELAKTVVALRFIGYDGWPSETGKGMTYLFDVKVESKSRRISLEVNNIIPGTSYKVVSFFPGNYKDIAAAVTVLNVATGESKQLKMSELYTLH